MGRQVSSALLLNVLHCCSSTQTWSGNLGLESSGAPSNMMHPLLLLELHKASEPAAPADAALPANVASR